MPDTPRPSNEPSEIELEVETITRNPLPQDLTRHVFLDLSGNLLHILDNSKSYFVGQTIPIYLENTQTYKILKREPHREIIPSRLVTFYFVKPD